MMRWGNEHPRKTGSPLRIQYIAEISGMEPDRQASQTMQVQTFDGLGKEMEMSGGHFDYACYKIMQFADDLGNELDEQGRQMDHWTKPVWTPEVATKLREIASLARYLGGLAQAAEWLYSGDTGEEAFMKHVSVIEKRGTTND